MAIFQFFKMAAALMLDFQSLDFLTVKRGKRVNCITVPNFGTIDQTTAETWRYFDFSKWRPPPFWIFKI